MRFNRSMGMLLLMVLLVASAVLIAANFDRARGTPPADARSNHLVSVQVLNEEGELVGPIAMPKVVKTDAEWRKQLTANQFRITRRAGTERAFSGPLLENKEEGIYACVCCGLPLFCSDAKYDSRTGWPSFFQPVARENVAEKPDHSHGMMRTEIVCTRCDGHLGHVFEDGPQPTGRRYCMNSEAMTFASRENLTSLADPITQREADAKNPPGYTTAVIAGGCFWCVEAVFEQLNGVDRAVSGYAGGAAETANYRDVSAGKTNHAEAIMIVYDPSEISYEALLRVHFATHDPTQLNRQGPDVGRHYRSAIFYANEEEKQIAERIIMELNESDEFSTPIVTTLEPFDAFYEAEANHQNFAKRNPQHPYIRRFALPKLETLHELFPEKVKDE